MAETQRSVFNVIGCEGADFLEEVTDSRLIKKNELFFSLMVGTLPGEPEYGAGIGLLVGELNTNNLVSSLERRVRERIPDEVPAVRVRGIVTQQDKTRQTVNADIHFTDLESKTDVYLPLGFTQK